MSNKHGHASGGKQSRVYSIWAGMLNRCTSPTSQAYHRYGGRGITVCDRWRVFNNFLEDMGEPQPNFTLDRINNDAGYSPENCRWATRREQSNNQSRNHLITYNNITLTIAEWARQLGVAHSIIFLRIKRGWPLDRALTEIPKHHRVGLYYKYNGENKTLQEWAKSSGIQYWTLRARLKAGWDFHQAITTDVIHGRNQFTRKGKN